MALVCFLHTLLGMGSLKPASGLQMSPPLNTLLYIQHLSSPSVCILPFRSSSLCVSRRSWSTSTRPAMRSTSWSCSWMWESCLCSSHNVRTLTDCSLVVLLSHPQLTHSVMQDSLNVIFNVVSCVCSLQDARSSYRRILTDSARKLNAQGAQLGACIEKARPYYEARRLAKEVCVVAAHESSVYLHGLVWAIYTQSAVW